MSICLAGLFAVPQTVVTNKETINVSCSLPEKKTIPSLQVNHFCSYNKSDPRPAPGPIIRPKVQDPIKHSGTLSQHGLRFATAPIPPRRIFPGRRDNDCPWRLSASTPWCVVHTAHDSRAVHIHAAHGDGARRGLLGCTFMHASNASLPRGKTEKSVIAPTSEGRWQVPGTSVFPFAQLYAKALCLSVSSSNKGLVGR